MTAEKIEPWHGQRKLLRRLEEGHGAAHVSAHGAEADVGVLGGPDHVGRDPLGGVGELSGAAERHVAGESDGRPLFRGAGARRFGARWRERDALGVCTEAPPETLPIAAAIAAVTTAKLASVDAEATLRMAARRSRSGTCCFDRTPATARSPARRASSAASTDQAPPPPTTSGVQAKKKTMSEP